MWFSQAECLFEEALLRGGLVEQRQHQDPYEFLKALLLSAGSSAGSAGGCGQASAHHDGLHEDHQRVAPSGGPGGLYTAVASSSTEYGLLFAEYVTQHKEESGKPAHHDDLHQVIRAVASSGVPGGLYTAVASSSTEYGPLFAEYVTQHKEESGKPAHRDGLHEGHQSGSPIWRPLHSIRLFLNGVRTPLFAEYVTQHKEESGKPAHRDGLHEGHQSGGPIRRPRWPMHSSRFSLNSVWTPHC